MAVSLLSSLQRRLSRKLHLWVIVALFVLITTLHYAEQIGLPWAMPPSYHFGLTRHVLDRILFLLPVIYTGYVFGPITGYGVCCAALLVMFLRAIAVSPAPGDALLETLAVTLVGALTNAMVGKRAKEKKILLGALVKSQTANVLLRHTRSAGGGEVSGREGADMAKSSNEEEAQLGPIQAQIEALFSKVERLEEREDKRDGEIVLTAYLERRLKALEEAMNRLEGELRKIGENLALTSSPEDSISAL